MPYCTKCGAELTGEIKFCPKCGASLGPSPPRAQMEKEEKREKREKSEKAEKREKGEYGSRWMYIGLLIGGFVIILAGLNVYLRIVSDWYARYSEAVFLIVIGILVILIAIYATMTAAKRSPRPP
ncbi:MAG: zinc ribbon domain-containing protein [Candidatus Bathyarchaeota archaeon]|nr:MAG: zinc ribbon domain-containing protein [Candidatus Bathyarchaeota archaeon]